MANKGCTLAIKASNEGVLPISLAELSANFSDEKNKVIS
jgi:hypothetical protein